MLLVVLLCAGPTQARRYDTAAGPDQAVFFADARLKASVELHLGIADPTPADMLALTHLYVAGWDIVQLTGLEYAKNLVYADLGAAFSQGGGVPTVYRNRVVDISVLGELTSLRWLNLSDNNVVDISPLSGLTALETLTLYGNQVVDITPLSRLVGLTRLDLERNRITDASALSGLTSLVWLNLSSNRLAEVSTLSMLTGLETLFLDRIGLESLDELSGLPNLKYLSVLGNQIEDISGLTAFTGLETVVLYGNRVASIPPLPGLSRLRSLALGINRIVDISGLSGLSSLEAVDLQNNRIDAIPVLAGLGNLKILDCGYNVITDVSGLSALPALEAVTLRNNRITGFPALAGLPNVKLLDLGGNQIEEVPDLSGLPNLQVLDLESNLITVVRAMPELPNLKSLNLAQNQIADISGLTGPPTLESLDLDGNEIVDIASLTVLESLRQLNLRYNPLGEGAYSDDLPDIEAGNPGIDLNYDPSPWAFTPRPYNGAADVTQTPVLLWTTGAYTAQHDVYFGEDAQAVADANAGTVGIYCGRQDLDRTAYDPGVLEWNKTYYWRVDEVNEAESWELIQGTVWSFTTAGFIVVDDFELYDDRIDANQAIFQTWFDGLGFGARYAGPYFPGNGTGSSVGHSEAPFAEQTIVHGGRQSMPLDYSNADPPRYSQTDRTWPMPQDWTVNGMETLQLFFRGAGGNGPADLYVSIEDSAGRAALLVNPDPDALQTVEWKQWNIPLADLAAHGVDALAVRKMSIGVGNPANPRPDGSGRIYFDDIRVVKPEPVVPVEAPTGTGSD